MAILLQRGVPVAALQGLFSTADTKSASYEVPTAAGRQSQFVSFHLVTVGVPVSITVSLEGSMVDVDASYAAFANSTNPNGQIVNVVAAFKFVRVRQSARSGGTSITVYLIYV